MVEDACILLICDGGFYGLRVICIDSNGEGVCI